MDWVAIFAGNTMLFSGVGILVAAVFTCWRAGSFHPINARLLRLFISKDEIEDQVIRKSLADQAALASFRMTHGIKVPTLTDAKNLAIFADHRNIPLGLIGRAGWAFDLKKLVINPKRVISKIWLGFLTLLLLLMLIAVAVFSVVAASNSLLVSLKGTGTWLWLSQDEAIAALPLFIGRRESINGAACKNNQRSPEIPNSFKQPDQKILCDIWADPKLEGHLAKEVQMQLRASLMVLAFLIWCSIIALLKMREWLAAIELHKLL